MFINEIQWNKSWFTHLVEYYVAMYKEWDSSKCTDKERRSLWHISQVKRQVAVKCVL